MRHYLRYFKRLTHIDKNTKINPLAHVLLYISFALGFCFAVIPDQSGADDSVLYQATVSSIGGVYTNLFGIVLVVVSVLNTLTLLLRKPTMGDIAALLGFMSWVFVATMYALSEFWYGVVVYAVPNVYFWFWYYKRLSYLSKITPMPDPLRETPRYGRL